MRRSDSEQIPEAGMLHESGARWKKAGHSSGQSSEGELHLLAAACVVGIGVVRFGFVEEVGSGRESLCGSIGGYGSRKGRAGLDTSTDKRDKR